jgi:ribosomal protein S18 acetylase RimI-like enzyme
MINIISISEEHIESFHEALDSVCKEKIYISRFEAPPLDKTRDFILNNIKNNVPQYVALSNNKVIGWCDITLNEKPTFKHCGRLGIGIIAGYRSQGIGNTLLNITLKKAEEIGIERVELEVYENNKRAIKLYKRNGFKIEGKKIKSSKIDGKYCNNLIMAKFLKRI